MDGIGRRRLRVSRIVDPLGLAAQEKVVSGLSGGQCFRDMVLSRGGTKDAAVLHREFRGRDAAPDALLEERAEVDVWVLSGVVLIVASRAARTGP
jgi:hypothetical protein